MNENAPVCACHNSGNPFLINGVEWVSRSPSCRVHRVVLSTSTYVISAETNIPGDWKKREKAEDAD